MKTTNSGHNVTNSNTSEASITDILDRLIKLTLDVGATDVHLTSEGARMRVAGQIHDLPAHYDPQIWRNILTRLKINADIDIQYCPMPRDGKIHMVHAGKEYRIMVNIFPSNQSEKATLSILPLENNETIDSLNLEPHTANNLRKQLTERSGLIVIAGATGAGKSTSFYALLKAARDSEKRIIQTLEISLSPNAIPGICQSQLYPGNGFTMENALYGIKRCHADVLGLDEVTDKKGFQAAILASTSQLVILCTQSRTAQEAYELLCQFSPSAILLEQNLKGILIPETYPRLCQKCEGHKEIQNCPVCSGTGITGRIIVSSYTESTGKLTLENFSASQIKADNKKLCMLKKLRESRVCSKT